MRSFTLLICAFSLAAGASGYEPPSPAGEVKTALFEWHDAARDRDVPAKIYFPGKGQGALPVVIFSHGLGGSREGYEYLGRQWAGCGYVSVHLQHHGSDNAVWEGIPPNERLNAMRNSTKDIRNSTNRPLDVTFAIDQLTKLNADAESPLKGRLDLSRIAVAGHSFGGFTAMAIAGQKLGPKGVQMTDPRVKCAIEMSAPVPRGPLREHAYDGITMPMLHMTGTKDVAPVGDTTPEERRIPFDETTHGDTSLVIFKDGDHMIFSGRSTEQRNTAADETFHRLICAGTTAFLDAFLKGNEDARVWLTEGGYKKLVGETGTFESKRAAK